MLRLPRGPFIKYVTLFWTNLTPFPFHTLSYISRPPKVRHTSRNPPTFSSTCIHTYVFTGRFVLVRGGSFLGFSLEVFVWKVLFGVVFVRPPFCQNTSVTSERALRSSGIEAAIGARCPGLRPLDYFAVQRPWTSR